MAEATSPPSRSTETSLDESTVPVPDPNPRTSPVATGQSIPEVSIDLVKALQAFVDARSLADNLDSNWENRVSKSDVFWLLTTFITAVIVISLVPEAIFRESRFSFIVDTLLPWATSTFLFVVYTWFKQSMIRLTRHGLFRGALILSLCLAIFPYLDLFAVVPTTNVDPVKILVDDEQKLTFPFHVGFRSHSVKVQTDSVAGTFDLSPFALQPWGVYTPCWSPEIPIKLNCVDTEASVSIAIDDKNLDCITLFTRRIREQGYQTVSAKRGLQLDCGSSEAYNLKLIAGTYSITTNKLGCEPSVIKEHITATNGSQILTAIPCI